MSANQSKFDVRFEWGEQGLAAVGSGSAVIIIVDVLSFCTCVDVAVARGAVILPYRWRNGSASQYAKEQRAELAGSHRRIDGYSLSPSSLINIQPGVRLVLPSPNGATLSLLASALSTTVAACLRNAAAVARFAQARGGPVSVIASGERWGDGSLRPAWEDLVGAGAVIAGLNGTRSPEASAAVEAFQHAASRLLQELHACSSGQELIERGFAADVELAASSDSSHAVPVLVGDAFLLNSS